MLYEPLTGRLVRVSPGRGVKVGEVIGTLTAAGYRAVNYKGRQWLVHRLAWFLMTGEEPEQIDHINGCRQDNRFCNLRAVTNRQNQEARHTVVAVSGLMGAYLRKDTGKFAARIKSHGRIHNLGVYDTADQAHSAYLAAKKIYHSTHPNVP